MGKPTLVLLLVLNTTRMTLYAALAGSSSLACSLARIATPGRPYRLSLPHRIAERWTRWKRPSLRQRAR